LRKLFSTVARFIKRILTELESERIVREIMYKHGTNHENCWRDCDIHPDAECFVFECPNNPRPQYDCDEGKSKTMKEWLIDRQVNGDDGAGYCDDCPGCANCTEEESK
jgi:hypothetical protein